MNNFQAGIEAYKAGENEEAEKYFRAALNENPKDEKAWQWLYQVSDNPSMRIACLKRILEINPANEQARQELNRITPRKLKPPPVKKYVVPTVSDETNNATQTRNILIGSLSIAVLCFICICAYVLYDPTDGTKDYSTMAFIQCRLYVEDRLVSPSTADFPSALLADVRDVGNNVFEIRSHVDSQNSFGAMIRTNYFCKIQYVGTAEDEESNSIYWTLLQLDFLE